MLISQFGYCTVIMQDVTIGAGWVNGARDLPVHFFATSCESIIFRN